MTLLNMVQDILNDMDSDEVNSVNDTIESMQVAQIIKTTYYEMLGSRNWPHLKKLIQLQASTDGDKPTKMRLGENVKELLFVKYDKRGLTNEDNPFDDDASIRRMYRDVQYLTPEEFLNLTNSRDNSKENFLMVQEDFVELIIQTDKAPQYYTTFDDEYLFFDSYDSQVDDTLQSSKTQVMAYVEPSWRPIDTFVPFLPSEAFPALLAEAKSTCFLVLKQMQNAKAEQQSRRQQQWLSRKAWKVSDEPVYPSYGRNSIKGGGSWKFNKGR